MKNKYKYIMCFVLGGIFFSVITAYASNVISGSDVSYSNLTSKLTSTNVQSAIDELNQKSNKGNALSSEILSGKTALVGGNLITGTMTNNGSWTSTPTTNGKVTIPAGYHDGTGYVNTSSIYNAGVAAGKTSTSATLLWTNPNPTSAFAADTTLTISNLSNYKYITFVSKFSTSAEYTPVVYNTVERKENVLFGLTATAPNSGYYAVYWRSYVFSGNTIQFKNYSSETTLTIPVYIYGSNNFIL